jgi:hypothetical protein
VRCPLGIPDDQEVVVIGDGRAIETRLVHLVESATADRRLMLNRIALQIIMTFS